MTNPAYKLMFSAIQQHEALAEKTSRDGTLPKDLRAERVAKHIGAALALKQVVISLRNAERVASVKP